MSLPEVIQCKLWEHVEEIVDQLKPSEPGVAALADRNGRLPLHHAADFSCPVALVAAALRVPGSRALCR